jgi:hypothetical protein
VTDIQVVSGATSRDRYLLRVTAVDPDGRPRWDPALMVRADTDGDGIYDSPWSFADSDGATLLPMSFTSGGRYTLSFQARDGFYGLSPAQTFTLDVPQYVPVACTTSSACPANEYCALSESAACGASGQGVCEPRPQGCGWSPAPVCGCDNTTYLNACYALMAGASVQHAGQCAADATACGGPDGLACNNPMQYCDYGPATHCGAGGAWGTCQFAGGIACSDEPSPVCGCDGSTFGSACQASRAGVAIDHEGACAVVSDCRTTGCDLGQVCQSCRSGVAMCLPEGRIC